MIKPMFIVIDGPDGSGKTTLARALVNELNKITSAIYTFEPTAGENGKKIRKLLQLGISDPYVLTDLLTKDRREHLTSCIQPHLEKGDTVICDRYKYSALVYQQLMGVEPQYLIQCNKEFLVPDLVFILMTTDVKILMNRIAMRGLTRDIVEHLDFIKQTLVYYKKIPEYFPQESIIFLNCIEPIDNNLRIIQNNIALL